MPPGRIPASSISSSFSLNLPFREDCFSPVKQDKGRTMVRSQGVFVPLAQALTLYYGTGCNLMSRRPDKATRGMPGAKNHEYRNLVHGNENRRRILPLLREKGKIGEAGDHRIPGHGSRAGRRGPWRRLPLLRRAVLRRGLFPSGNGQPDSARQREGAHRAERNGGPPPVCYCFNHTVEEIEAGVVRTGTSGIPDEITENCRKGLDRCEETNPPGPCC